ncbi:hypothetical protein BU24DRAFT_458083 [Aaosphaeria arxii CBS 175.79]|uniref:Uncharacterized protein n=1 Tax=Aaosphaeria arxii CBS 175.79 TaxID=1450172 RepID=A0A6A5YAF3_9PLEO|nr:uncharacterized protein BU24DRAFT_458083 [Aaosphaeria arxii CBS 175.79]KAF2022206.1 hypothetical protein BU24DRAFT_458083 [Aaosphaeria arxii CBS 175.79]
MLSRGRSGTLVAVGIGTVTSVAGKPIDGLPRDKSGREIAGETFGRDAEGIATGMEPIGGRMGADNTGSAPSADTAGTDRIGPRRGTEASGGRSGAERMGSDASGARMGRDAAGMTDGTDTGDGAGADSGGWDAAGIDSGGSDANGSDATDNGPSESDGAAEGTAISVVGRRDTTGTDRSPDATGGIATRDALEGTGGSSEPAAVGITGAETVRVIAEAATDGIETGGTTIDEDGSFTDEITDGGRFKGINAIAVVTTARVPILLTTPPTLAATPETPLSEQRCRVLS